MQLHGDPLTLLFLGQDKLRGKILQALLGLRQLSRPFPHPSKSNAD